MTDDEAAAHIRAEEIDILVNLNGYFGAPRMGVFARRAAPIQVNYLGFPGHPGRALYGLHHRRPHRDPGSKTSASMTNRWSGCRDSYQVNDAARAIAPDVPSRAALRAAGGRLCVLQFQPELQADAGHLRPLDADSESSGRQRAVAAGRQCRLSGQSAAGGRSGRRGGRAAGLRAIAAARTSIWRG